MRRCLLTLCLLLPMPAAAEPLAVFHWAGSEAAADAGYAGSRTQALVDLMEPDRLADAAARVQAALLERNPSPDAEVALDILGKLRRVSWKAPVTAWLDAEPGAGGAPPAFSGGVRWGVTDPADEAELLSALRSILADLGDPPALELRQGDGVTLVYEDAAEAPAAPPAAEAMVFLDAQVAPVVSFFADLAAEDLPPAEADKLRAVLGVLRPEAFERFTLAQRFNAAGLWETRVEVDAPAPRSGLAALLIDTPAVEDADLAPVPADAPVVTAFGLDLAGAFGLFREALRAADPAVDAQLADALAQAREATGVDLEADLLANLSPVHALFQDPAVAGESFAGFLFTNRLRDPEAFGAALATAVGFVNAVVEAQTDELPVSGRAFTSEVAGVPVTTVPLPGLAPSFAVVDGRFVFGLYPQALAAVLDRREAGGGGILGREAFAGPLAEARNRGGRGGAVGSVSFVDLPELAPAAYGSLLLVEHLGTGLASMASREPVPPVLPPFARVRPLLAPSFSAARGTDAGWASDAVVPFPGASLLAGGGGGAQGLLIVPGVIGGLVEGMNQEAYNEPFDDEPFPPFPDAPPAPAPPPAPGAVDPPPPSPF